VAAVGSVGRLHGVEAFANGTVADGVEVHLEAERVECRDVLAKLGRVNEGDTGVGGVMPTAVEVGLGHGGGEVLGDTVLHDLHTGRGEAAGLPVRATLHQFGDLLSAPSTVPPEGADHPSGELAGCASRQVGGRRVAGVSVRAEDGI